MVAKSFVQRKITKVLSSPRTIEQLVELLEIPERTLRYHLRILRRNGAIRETILFSDRRKKLLSARTLNE